MINLSLKSSFKLGVIYAELLNARDILGNGQVEDVDYKLKEIIRLLDHYIVRDVYGINENIDAENYHLKEVYGIGKNDKI